MGLTLGFTTGVPLVCVSGVTGSVTGVLKFRAVAGGNDHFCRSGTKLKSGINSLIFGSPMKANNFYVNGEGGTGVCVITCIEKQ